EGAPKLPLIEHWDRKNWRIVPNAGPEGQFSAVAAVGANDIWAVGEAEQGRPFIEHWDGRHWSVVQNPGPTKDDPNGLALSLALSGIAAVSAHDVWAVGSSGIEHWDGKRWSVVPNSVSADLSSIGAASSTNIWAVGGLGDGNDPKPVAEHWDGRA